MKTYIYSFLLFITLLSCSISKNVESKPIFRYINLYDGRIELGDKIKNIAPSIKIPDNKIYLKMRENAGGETKSIELIPDSNGKIASIIFEYGNETNLKSKIEDYKYLGTPKINGKRATWNDGKTLFEVYEQNNNVVYSKMTDLKNNLH